MKKNFPVLLSNILLFLRLSSLLISSGFLFHSPAALIFGHLHVRPLVQYFVTILGCSPSQYIGIAILLDFCTYCNRWSSHANRERELCNTFKTLYFVTSCRKRLDSLL